MNKFTLDLDSAGITRYGEQKGVLKQTIRGVSVKKGVLFMHNKHEKIGWRLTFQDEFDRPQLDDMYWYGAYRSGRKEYFKRKGIASRWVDHNAHYVIEDSVLKLRIAEDLPFRPDKSHQCVSCIATSDHRFGPTAAEYQVLEKFSQKYGWFETRARCPRGSGLMSAFWLHQCNPLHQEYTPDGIRKGIDDGVLEIDIFEQQGRYITSSESKADLNVHFTEEGHYLRALPVDVSEDFHVWALDWEEGRISWYFDDAMIERYTGPTPQEKMFMLLALFQYSGWIGEIDKKITYPRDFEIDYVRVYQRADNLL